MGRNNFSFIKFILSSSLLLVVIIAFCGLLWDELLGVGASMRKKFYPDESRAISRISEKPTPASKPILENCTGADTLQYIYYENPSGELLNNKVGLYVYAENEGFLKLAKELVNSNGGDWGYVLIPYNVKDRDDGKWNRVFRQLTEYHLIPIIQLWDVDPDDYKKSTKKAAEFLNSFVWPIKERYISVYNETNDAKFWRGKLDPKGYAKVLNYTIDTFKSENTNFFMLNGAFNTSAPNASDYMDAESYMYAMNQEVPGIFNKLDGWASHSYPQPDFSGSPYAYGRWSIRAYENELSFLKNTLAVKKQLPVFITETGWAHAEGKNYNSRYLPVSKVAEYTKIAYEEVWMRDNRVRAVTPFTIWYDAPFDHFSWVDGDNKPYLHYDAVKHIKKEAGTPSTVRLQSTGLSECP